MVMNSFDDKASFIWSVADLLRGPYRPNQYKDIMLPMTVFRRLDCVLEPTKDKLLDQNEEITAKFLNVEQFREIVSKHLLKEVYNQIRTESQ